MKSENGVFAPIVVGGGFIVIVVSSVFCGAAALKFLLADSPQQPQVIKQETQATNNYCLLICKAGSTK